jgi:uncharacterized protein
MSLLLASCVALVLGPLTIKLTGARPRVIAAMDGFVLVAVLGLVFLHLLPHAVLDAGTAALVAGGIGILIPLFLEKVASKPFKAKAVRPVMVVLALVALATHGLMDGAALVETHHDHEGGHGLGLGVGVLLHRIPLGLTLWWMVRGAFGTRVAVGVLGGMMAATVGGYFAGETVMASLSFESIAVFQALMAGSILHVALDSPPVPSTEYHSDTYILNIFGLVGAALGAGVVWAVGRLHPMSMALDGELEASETFWALMLQASPALLLAFFGAGLLHGFIKPNWMDFLRSGGRFQQAVKGVAVGIPVPICSCGVLPFYRSLIEKGVPPAAAVGFLIATPELGLDAFLLSFPLLGADLAITRLVVAALVAVLVGWLLSRFFEDKQSAVRIEEMGVKSLPVGSVKDRLRNSFHFGFSEFVDDILPWVILGVGIATVAEPVMEVAAFGSIPDVLEVPLFALVGIPVYVCASGATPLGAVLLHKGLSAGALIAFLMTGPATNISTFGVLRTMHGSRAAWAFALGVFGFSVAFGWGVNELLVDTHGAEIHAWADQHSTWWEEGSVGLVGLLFLSCLWRLGPRGFLAALVPGLPMSIGAEVGGSGHPHHNHAHQHSHEHNHGAGVGHEAHDHKHP